ncbi:YeeE/YedE family protein [Rhodosalinus sp. FB01]|uniref:YeeE/YedE family protein n=1 Tax=Rhodosalinus sp. FB01 TaxID=3239194 RepID=UPI00352582E5
MLEMIPESWAVALIGAGGGILLGLAARLGRFCTLGAIEDLLYGGSARRMHMWLLAIGVAVTGTFALTAAGIVRPELSFYYAIEWMPLASILGGLAFGYGMALAGNCGYGAIARLGGGDLRSFVIVLVMGVSAYAVLMGPLAPLRDLLFPQRDVTGVAPALPALAEAWTGVPAVAIGLGAGLALCALALASRELRGDASAVFWAGMVGVAVVAGWAGTTWVATTGFEALPVQSHSFSAPVGESILFAMTGSARPVSFAVGSIAGVWAGAFIGSLVKGHFRWEACEDPRELRRQIFGAMLMGGGAVVAMGCSVGQGVSAFSVLAVSAPVTLLSILAGAALGLRPLIEGFQPAE